MVKEFEKGKWYVFNGVKGSSFNDEGKMDLVLDRKPHLCISADGQSATFKGQEKCTNSTFFSIGSGDWNWSCVISLFKKVPDSKLTDEMIEEAEELTTALTLKLVHTSINTKNPKVNMSDVILEKEVKDRVLRNIREKDKRNSFLSKFKISKINEKGNGTVLLFVGDSGTGKTMMAEAIAKELKKPLLIVTRDSLVNHLYGAEENNLQKIFDFSNDNDVVLCFDECESFISDRNSSEDIYSRIDKQATSVFLSKMEQFKGVMILTTNLSKNIDYAVQRRLTDVVVFNNPEIEQRKLLWKNMLANDLGLDLDYDKLAKTFEISGGFIKQAVMNTLNECAYYGCELNTDKLIDITQKTLSGQMELKNNHLNKSKFNHSENNVLKALGLKNRDLSEFHDRLKKTLQNCDTLSEAVELTSKFSDKDRLIFSLVLLAGMMSFGKDKDNLVDEKLKVDDIDNKFKSMVG